MQPPLISHSICRKMQKKRCEGQNPTSAETEAKTTWFLVITKLMKRNKKHTGEAYPHLLETRYFFPAWKYEEMSLLLLSSPWSKSRHGMSQQNNWADSSLLQGRCLCIRNATRKQNIYLPSFHKTERFRSAMDRMSHKPVLPAPLMPVWPALGCTTGRANLSMQVTSGLRSGSKKLPKWHAP